MFGTEALRLDEGGILQLLEELQHFVLQVNVQCSVGIQMQMIERIKIRHPQGRHEVGPERICCFALDVRDGLRLRCARKELQRGGLDCIREILRDASVGLELPDIEIRARFERAAILHQIE